MCDIKKECAPELTTHVHRVTIYMCVYTWHKIWYFWNKVDNNIHLSGIYTTMYLIFLIIWEEKIYVPMR